MAEELNNQKIENQPEQEEIVATDEEGNPLKPKKAAKAAPAESDDIVSEEGGDNEIKKLREKLAKAVEEKQQYLDNWQRDKAEFINTRKRDQESNAQFVKYAKEEVIIEIIPVLDSFEMAFANKEAWEKVDKNWRTGVEYIHSQLVNVLKNNSVEEVNPLGEKFDHMRDEALEFEPVTEEKYDNVITKVIQKGYKLNGKIIKAPKVKVGEFKK